MKKVETDVDVGINADKKSADNGFFRGTHTN